MSYSLFTLSLILCASLSKNLSKTLSLINTYTIDFKTTKRSLVNEPDCPEFPDSEWKNVIHGRAVNLDAVLSGQLSTSNDDLKVQKFGDFEISFGAVELTKVVKNGGDWSIASYGEYIINLFSVTHPSVHGRVIAFDKAVRKRIGSVRSLELSDFEKFADLKIAHMDSIGASVISATCNKWNDGKCGQAEEECKRRHVCNKC